MAQYFNFKRLIKKYSTDFVAEIPPEGYWDEAGDWQKGEPKQIQLRGAIISHRESKIFRSEGTITGQDRALYMIEPLENALQMAKIIYDGKVYSIGDLLENSEFTGVWAYTLKYVSAFKQVTPEYDITEDIEDLEDRLDGVLVNNEDSGSDGDNEFDETDYVDEFEQRLDGV